MLEKCEQKPNNENGISHLVINKKRRKRVFVQNIDFINDMNSIISGLGNPHAFFPNMLNSIKFIMSDEQFEGLGRIFPFEEFFNYMINNKKSDFFDILLDIISRMVFCRSKNKLTILTQFHLDVIMEYLQESQIYQKKSCLRYLIVFCCYCSDHISHILSQNFLHVLIVMKPYKVTINLLSYLMFNEYTLFNDVVHFLSLFLLERKPSIIIGTLTIFQRIYLRSEDEDLKAQIVDCIISNIGHISGFGHNDCYTMLFQFISLIPSLDITYFLYIVEIMKERDGTENSDSLLQIGANCLTKHCHEWNNDENAKLLYEFLSNNLLERPFKVLKSFFIAITSYFDFQTWPYDSLVDMILNVIEISEMSSHCIEATLNLIRLYPKDIKIIELQFIAQEIASTLVNDKNEKTSSSATKFLEELREFE